MKQFIDILEQYGVVGYNAIAKAVLAALVTQEPILLVGEQGTGKTLLAERLAIALGISSLGEKKEFNAYDASKSMFEDVIGFPDPVKMQTGELAYIESPITIWNKKFVLIDEISRANPAMQNKWFEIIRSRRLMGKEITGLKYIFAAMNPSDYSGTGLLDSALADRFMFIVKVPDSFKRSDLIKIINNHTKSLQSESSELREMIAGIKGVIASPDERLNRKINEYIVDFAKKCEELDCPFSPRRCALLKKAMDAFAAIDIYFNENADQQLPGNFGFATASSWNYFVSDEDHRTDILKEAYHYSVQADKTIKGSETKKQFNAYLNNNNKNSSKVRNAPQPITPADPDDDDASGLVGDVKGLGQIFGAGLELFTVGFYEMVIKKNGSWKSKLKINN